jgi:hypothetical protein
VVEFMAVGDAPENVAGLIAADAQVHRLEGTEVFLPGFLAFPAVRDGVAQENDVAHALAFFDPLKELFVSRDVAVELLDSRVVHGLLLRSQDGRQQAESQHAAGGDHAVHNNLVCDRVSPLTLSGILWNGWLALQELGRNKAAALQISRRLTNTVDVTDARNARDFAPMEAKRTRDRLLSSAWYDDRKKRTAHNQPADRIMGGIPVLVLSPSMAATQDKPVAPAEQYRALLKES